MNLLLHILVSVVLSGMSGLQLLYRLCSLLWGFIIAEFVCLLCFFPVVFQTVVATGNLGFLFSV